MANTADDIMRVAHAKESQRVMVRLVQKHNLEQEMLLKNHKIELEKLNAQIRNLEVELQQCKQESKEQLEKMKIQFTQEITVEVNAKLAAEFEAKKKEMKNAFDSKLQEVVDEFGIAMDEGI